MVFHSLKSLNNPLASVMKVIDIDMVDKLMGGGILEAVDRYMPIMQRLEEHLERPFISQWVVYLRDRIRAQPVERVR